MKRKFDQHRGHMSGSIWFLLVDATTGKPYRGAAIASIPRFPTVPNVDRFRATVKSSYGESCFLNGVSSCCLIVFKNKASFDRRDAASGREGPLMSSSRLDGLGETETEPLIVVVPQELHSFSLCVEPFFNSMFDVSECDGTISFGECIPSTSLKKLYIRSSYRTIAARIRNGMNKAMIAGTPGIGKYLFLIYLLWKLVKEGKRVLFTYHPHSIYYDGKGNCFELTGDLPRLTDRSFWNETLWCLFDARWKKEADLNKFPHDRCTFVLSTSPRREMINDFDKPPVPQVFYMPVWTITELEMIAPLFPRAHKWRTRFEVLGGVPRYIFEDRRRDPTTILENACKKCTLDDCIRIIGYDCEIDEKTKVIHSLVHMTSTTPFTIPSVRFASLSALNIIVRCKTEEGKRKMRDLLSSCAGDPRVASFCGQIFEPYAIELLEKGGDFTCRKLVHGNAKIKPPETKLSIFPSNKIVVDQVRPNQTINQVHVPKKSNYPAIDAWIPGIGAFQITVGKKHNIKDGVRIDLAMIGGPERLYWLLPPLYFDSFTKKSPLDIDQYAVLIPYP